MNNNFKKKQKFRLWETLDARAGGLQRHCRRLSTSMVWRCNIQPVDKYLNEEHLHGLSTLARGLQKN